MKVSFAFAILNESLRLDKCLSSIRSQIYPQNLIEIVIADGGSEDNSKEISINYNAVVIDNPAGLAEPGGVLAHSYASGDIKIFFAADNVLPHEKWVKELVDIYNSNPNIVGVYTHIASSKNDYKLNKYYSELHVEPFTFFIYGNAANPRYFDSLYEQIHTLGPYKHYKFDIENHPLIAFAQGFSVRNTYIRPDDTIMDDIEPVMRMIDSNQIFVYGPQLGIHHYHLSTFKNYIKKFKIRIDNTLQNNDFGINSRNKRLNLKRRLNKYVFIMCGLLIIPTLVETLFLTISRKNLVMLYHAPASIILAYLILFRYINNILK